MTSLQNNRNKTVTMKNVFFSFLALWAWLFFGCEALTNNPYGQLGGADQTQTYLPGEVDEEGEEKFETIMSFMSGVWYSRYAGIGRLDGYRIGKWSDFDEQVGESGKDALFPARVIPSVTYTVESGTNTPGEDDYFVFYDDTVYGEGDDGSGGNGGWEEFDLVTRYIGIVRGVNVFNGDPGRGAIVIEYLKGCAPLWLDRWPASSNGKAPFFGIYYRVKDNDTVQMANAVDLAALYNGEGYYTETAHLAEAIKKNNVENEAEFIAWGVVIPQKRER
jgi:hypothetical protein